MLKHSLLYLRVNFAEHIAVPDKTNLFFGAASTLLRLKNIFTIKFEGKKIQKIFNIFPAGLQHGNRKYLLVHSYHLLGLGRTHPPLPEFPVSLKYRIVSKSSQFDFLPLLCHIWRRQILEC